ncbi:MAG: hypothetical protein E7G24_16180, partial [Clostridium celatum]|nr:hypothetical protein [Clostridium celatum]
FRLYYVYSSLNIATSKDKACFTCGYLYSNILKNNNKRSNISNLKVYGFDISDEMISWVRENRVTSKSIALILKN